MAPHKWVLVRIGPPAVVDPLHPTEYTLDPNTMNELGRGRQNTIILTSLLVSRRHCNFVYDDSDKHFSVTDLQSENGTFINGEKQQASVPVKLNCGDILGIGVDEYITHTSFLFEVIQVFIGPHPYGPHVDNNAVPKIEIPVDNAHVPGPSAVLGRAIRNEEMPENSPDLKSNSLMNVAGPSRASNTTSNAGIAPPPCNTSGNDKVPASSHRTVSLQAGDNDSVPPHLPSKRARDDRADTDEGLKTKVRRLQINQEPDLPTDAPTNRPSLDSAILNMSTENNARAELDILNQPSNSEPNKSSVVIDILSDDEDRWVMANNQNPVSTACMKEEPVVDSSALDSPMVIDISDDEELIVSPTTPVGRIEARNTTSVKSDIIPISKTNNENNPFPDKKEFSNRAGCFQNILPIPVPSREDASRLSSEPELSRPASALRSSSLLPEPEIVDVYSDKILNGNSNFKHKAKNDATLSPGQEVVDLNSDQMPNEITSSVRKAENDELEKESFMSDFISAKDPPKDSIVKMFHSDSQLDAHNQSAYTVGEEDIIVIMDDDDDTMFPASQLFNDSCELDDVQDDDDDNDADDLLKQENVDEEDDNIILCDLDDDDSDSADGWYTKLSQGSCESKYKTDKNESGPVEPDLKDERENEMAVGSKSSAFNWQDVAKHDNALSDVEFISHVDKADEIISSDSDPKVLGQQGDKSLDAHAASDTESDIIEHRSSKRRKSVNKLFDSDSDTDEDRRPSWLGLSSYKAAKTLETLPGSSGYLKKLSSRNMMMTSTKKKTSKNLFDSSDDDNDDDGVAPLTTKSEANEAVGTRRRSTQLWDSSDDDQRSGPPVLRAEGNRSSDLESLKVHDSPPVLTSDDDISLPTSECMFEATNQLASDFDCDDEDDIPLTRLTSSMKKSRKGKSCPLELIEPLPLPPRRSHARGISASEAKRLYDKGNEERKKSEAEQKIGELKDLEDKRRKKKTEEERRAMEEEMRITKEDGIPVKIAKKRISTVTASIKRKAILPVVTTPSKNRARSKSKDSLPDTDVVKSAKMERSKMLKKLAEQEKAEKAEKLKELAKSKANKVPAKVVMKMTTKNRAELLAQEFTSEPIKKTVTEKPVTSVPNISSLPRIPRKASISLPNDSENLPHHKSNQSAFTDVHSETNLSPRNQFLESDLPQNSVPTLKKRSTSISGLSHTLHSSTAIKENLHTSKLLLHSNLPSTSTHNNVLSTKQDQQSTSNNIPNRELSSGLKSCLHHTRHKIKRSVRFREDKFLCLIRTFEVESNVQLQVVGKSKDVPIPNHPRTVSMPPSSSSNYQTLYYILAWRPEWPEQQLATGERMPPPVFGAHPLSAIRMLTQYASYDDYFKIVHPLMMLNLWASVAKDNTPHKQSLPVLVERVQPHPINLPSNKQLIRIDCLALLAGNVSHRMPQPKVGDLVVIELKGENDKAGDTQESSTQSTKSRVMAYRSSYAYVESYFKQPFSKNSQMHIDLFTAMAVNGQPRFQITMTLVTKKKDYAIQFDRVTRMRVVSYIKPALRSFEAVVRLPNSPLCGCILKPTIESYALAKVNILDYKPPSIAMNKLNITQTLAVLKTSVACLSNEAKICMIQGPPGTGKSHVIVNIILQVLSKSRKQRILLCAPSNAALDEIVLRLIQIRQKLPRRERYNLVRSGRLDSMDPEVRSISLEELVTKEIHSKKENANLESVRLEINTLKAKLERAKMSLESAKKNVNRNTASLERKCAAYENNLRELERGRSNGKSSYHQMQDRRETERVILTNAHIVASTLTSCSTHVMEKVFMQEGGKGMFTCCIVDEASQCSEPDTLITLLLGIKTLVLVGDPEQLPPTIHCELAKSLGFGQSLLSRLEKCFSDDNHNPIQMLTEQYRMHPNILRWPNSYFYFNRLVTPNGLERERTCPLVPYVILSHEYRQCSGSLSNRKEVELIGELTRCVSKLIATQNMSLGIITPYAKQREDIRRMLENGSTAAKDVAVNTIDGFQGKERDVIIMSCVRTSGTGFMTDAQRLNVALTRAKYSLIIVANFHSLKEDAMWNSLMEDGVRRLVFKNVPFLRTEEKLTQLVKR